MIDLLEEARGVEYAERLARAPAATSPPRPCWRATAAGHTSLGWPDAGEIAVGARADLVTIGMDSVRTAGAAGAWRWKRRCSAPRPLTCATW